MTGSGGVELLRADGTSLCQLPSLPIPTWGHTQNGLTTCGGTRGEIRQRCYTFDTGAGTWNISHSLKEVRAYHTAWQTRIGLILFGGSSAGVKGTELVTDAAETQLNPFKLQYSSRYQRTKYFRLRLSDLSRLRGLRESLKSSLKIRSRRPLDKLKN